MIGRVGAAGARLGVMSLGGGVKAAVSSGIDPPTYLEFWERDTGLVLASRKTTLTLAGRGTDLALNDRESTLTWNS